MADFIQNDLAIPTIAHLPAIYLTKDKVAETIADLDKVGVQKILALRGDIIPDVEPQKDFRYATDLIEFIKEQTLTLILLELAIRRASRFAKSDFRYSKS